MGDVTTDLKTRYSIFVPKPLARINLGDWQKREGASQSPKFGYIGVSIQTDSFLFVDVVKNTYIQARGGFNLQTTDMLQLAQKALFIATPDNATLGSDGLMTLAAGAGQAPTWTLDHGDFLEVYPYNSLQLHYRVEEVQNGLFEFFRGKRDRTPASATTGAAGVVTALLLKRDKVFNSAEPKLGSMLTAFNPLADKGVNWSNQKGSKETETVADLQGGFEKLAETSWQELFNSDAFKWGKAGDRIAPHDVFGELGGVRSQLTGDALTKFADDAEGKTTEKQLRYGFSGYFSRFDPYLLIDVDHPEVKSRFFLQFLAKLQNITVRLKRQVDVVYRIGSLIKDAALMKLAVNLWATVDAGFQAVQACRLQVQVWESVGRGTRGNLGDQFADEWQSGAGIKGKDGSTAKLTEISNDWNKASDKQATVRSAVPDSKKGFAGLRGDGAELQTGQTLTVTSDKGTTYTTPALTLPIPPKGAKVEGTAGLDTMTYGDGTLIWVRIDGGTTVEIDLTATATKKPKLESGAIDGLISANSALIGKKLTIKTDGATGVDHTFTAAEVASEAALSAAIVAAFPALAITLDTATHKLTFQNRKYGPGASIEVDAACDAAAVLGLSTTKQSGASLSDVQTLVQTKVNATFSGSTTLDAAAKTLTIKSPTTGSPSTVGLYEGAADVLAGLGLKATVATGSDARSLPKDLTAADIVSLLKKATAQVSTTDANGVVTTTTKSATDDFDFEVDGTQVLIKSKTKGEGSDVKVGGSMAAPLGFVGETNGDVEWDHIYDDERRQLDSFNKLDLEMLKMPDQMAALLRPATVLVKGAANAVNKALATSKALGKLSPLKLPQAKGAIGLIAKGGISLGTPDRLVGTGSKGVVFIADGQSGAADHSKFAMFEELINRVTAADPAAFLGAFASKDDKSWFKDRLKGVNPFKQPDKVNQAAVGFRVFSDSTVDLVARNTGNLLALGRGKDGNDVIGVGVARVAGSYAAEVIGREKVVIRTAKDDASSVEVIAKTIHLGAWDKASDLSELGPEDKGDIAKGMGTAGWGDDTTKNLQQTSKIFAHAADQACIVVGDYMIQVRNKTSSAVTLEDAQKAVTTHGDRKAYAAQNKTAWTLKQTTYNSAVTVLENNPVDSNPVLALLNGGEYDEILEETRQKAAEATQRVLHYTRVYDRASLRLATAQATLDGSYEDEGIVISVRDPADGKKSPNYMAMVGKPAISVSQKGITITTMADKKLTDAGDPASQPGARITLNEDGISILVGGKAGYVITKDYKLQITDGTNKAQVTANGWDFQTNAQVKFSAGQKITLG